MKRFLIALAMAAIALSVPAPRAAAQSVTTAVNSSAFPLSSNTLFPARGIRRLSLKCYNPTTNAAATITYDSGFAFVLQPGGSLWETGEKGPVPQGVVSATGTAAQTLPCEDSYLQ